MSTPFEYDAELSAVAQMWKPEDELIADIVAPRAPVTRRNFYFYQHNASDFRKKQNTMIGRRSEAELVEFTASKKDSSVVDHALRDIVPQDDINEAPKDSNPLHTATEGVIELVAFQREIRVAEAFANQSNFGKHMDLAAEGEKKLSDASINPLKLLDDYISNTYYAPNQLVMTRDDLNALRYHEKVVKSYNGTLGDDGKVPIQFIEDHLGLQVVTGQGKLPIEKEDGSIDFSTVWSSGNVALITTAKDKNIQSKRPSFMRTASLGKKTGSRRDTSIGGIDGGVEVLVGEKVREVIISKACGMLLTNAF